MQFTDYILIISCLISALEIKIQITDLNENKQVLRCKKFTCF